MLTVVYACFAIVGGVTIGYNVIAPAVQGAISGIKAGIRDLNAEKSGSGKNSVRETR